MESEKMGRDDGGIVPYEMLYGAGCMCAAAGRGYPALRMTGRQG